jgi:hypothetical protein
MKLETDSSVEPQQQQKSFPDTPTAVSVVVSSSSSFPGQLQKSPGLTVSQK